MEIVYTQTAINSLKSSLAFLRTKVSAKKLKEIRTQVFVKIDTLMDNPYSGQVEPFLEHLGLGHRRLIEGHFKIIYRVKEESIYITDIFDSRQSPDKIIL